MTAAPGITPHEVAAGQIDAWRGRCLNLFGRGEQAIGLALEVIKAAGHVSKVRHLGGQRTSDLVSFVAVEAATPKQKEALQRAINGWSDAETRRAYFAHGVSTVLIDDKGTWHVQLDFTDYRGSGSTQSRWNISSLEADDFEAMLGRALGSLSAQLGQLKKRVGS